ncbi:MAG TPA: hypothetical protein PKC18_17745, partial [Lacipirellulaceae bacterium]|nr:hypothetical protein [Lacipirellulaceae bacterium]
SLRLTPREPPDRAPRPEACVFSPDGRRIAYARTVEMPMGKFNQIFVLDVADALPRGADP